MISFESKGSFAKTEAFIKRMTTGEIYKALGRYGEVGRNALASATPQETGTAANAWSSQVSKKGGSWEISWSNSDVENGAQIVILLQYGHGTGTGGYVQGRDFINPAIKPIFDQIAEDVWKEVTRS